MGSSQEVVATTMIITPTVPSQTVSSDDMGSAESESGPVPDTHDRQYKQNGDTAKSNVVTLRQPVKQDGHEIHQLIKQCPPLDLNSVYTYLLLCEHFSQTSVVADVDGYIGGFVSAYLRPDCPDVLFVWQVAVHEKARGMGLGQHMLQSLLKRPSARAVRYLETTVGPDNVPSRRMFQALAADCGAQVNESALFDSELFGSEGHDDERLLRIGPITPKIIEEHTHEN